MLFIRCLIHLFSCLCEKCPQGHHHNTILEHHYSVTLFLTPPQPPQMASRHGGDVICCLFDGLNDIKDTYIFHWIHYQQKSLIALIGRRWATQAATYHETLAIPETKVTTLKNAMRVASEDNNSGSATVCRLYLHFIKTFQNRWQNTRLPMDVNVGILKLAFFHVMS